MLLQKSEYLIDRLLCGIVAEKAREIYAVRYFLDRVEAVKSIDTPPNSPVWQTIPPFTMQRSVSRTVFAPTSSNAFVAFTLPAS